jgi:hypothetical protein
MATITNLNVSCNSPRAEGHAESGEYNDNDGTIVADINWKFSVPNPTTGPHELQLLKQGCTVVSGVVNNKRLGESTYTVTKFSIKGNLTTLTKKT